MDRKRKPGGKGSPFASKLRPKIGVSKGISSKNKPNFKSSKNNKVKEGRPSGTSFKKFEKKGKGKMEDQPVQKKKHIANMTLEEQIEHLDRYLKSKPDMPQETRKEKREILKGLYKEKGRQETALATALYDKKYRAQKRREGQTVDANIEKIDKELETCTNNERKKQLQKELEKEKRNLQYVQYYPPHREYISLFDNLTEDNKKAIEKMKQKIEDGLFFGKIKATKAMIFENRHIVTDPQSLGTFSYNIDEDPFFSA